MLQIRKFRLLGLVLVAWVLVDAKCNQYDCSKASLDKCDFHMRQILTAPNDKFIAVTGQRICDSKTVTQEVHIFSKGQALNNLCGNTYITKDTSTALSIAWRDSTTLEVAAETYGDRNTLYLQKKVLKKVNVVYLKPNVNVIMGKD